MINREMFDKERFSHGFDEFVELDDFLKSYVHKNRATFEIEISTSPLRIKRLVEQDIVNRVSAKCHILIESVTELRSVESSEVVLQGVR